MDSTEERISRYSDILQRYPRHRAAINSYISKYGERNIAEKLYLYVYAPVITAFVDWVLEDAGTRGIKRLYFLSRDGRPMYDIAWIMSKQRGQDVELRYLRTSRFALRRAEYHLPGVDAVDRVCSDGIKVTFDKVMRRAVLTPEEADEIAAETGYADKRSHTLSKHELRQLRTSLKSSGKFQEYITSHAEEACDAARAYFTEQGLMEDTPYALVDSGWIGTIQESIGHICDRKDIQGYYFGLYSLPQDADKNNYHSYYFGPADHIRRKVLFANNVFESICSASEGMTLGYLKEDEKSGNTVADYTYVLSKSPNPNASLLEREIVILKRYARCYEECRELFFADTDVSCMVQELLTLAIARPCKTEAEIYGQRLFSDDMLDADLQPLAEVLDQKHIKQHFTINSIAARLGLSDAASAQTAWIEGSIVRAGYKAAGNLRAVKRRKYISILHNMRKP